MKIVLIEPLGIEAKKLDDLSEIIKVAGHEFVSYDQRSEDESILIERGKDADVIIVANLPFGKNVLKACTKLKMISIAFTGVDHVDIAYCKENDILVSNCAGYSTEAVAELAFGLMLGVYRRLVACNQVVRKEGTKTGLIGFELSGKTLGVIGTGAIGEKVINIGLAFGCKIIAYSRTEKAELIEKGVKYVNLEGVMSESDIISLHLPLNDKTKGMITKDYIDLMKPEAILINTARGPIIDNDNLAKALLEGRIAGAGIDVFEIEPPIPLEHKLISAPNTLLTPHVAFATKESLIKRAIIAIDNVDKWLNGKPQNII